MMKKPLVDPSIPFESHISYPKWANRSANKIITIDGVQYQKCVKCGETKLLSEFYSYYYYTNDRAKKKKYKNSCKKCHIEVVLKRRHSDIKFLKLKSLYDVNYARRKRNQAYLQDRKPYLKYIWQKSKEAGLLHNIRTKLKKEVEKKEKKRLSSKIRCERYRKKLAKKVRKAKKISHRIEQQQILDILNTTS